MIETPKIDLYLGRITSVKDRLTYEIEVEINGVGKELTAVPLSRGEVDEPVVGNLVIIMSVDPVYHSVNFYTKLKENDFIGFRSNGKIIDITPDSIIIGSDGSGNTYSDETHIPSPSLSYIKLDDSGNIEVMASADKKVTVSGNSTVEITGNSTVEITGNSNVNISGNNTIKTSGSTSIETSGTTNIKSSGECTVNCPTLTVSGGSAGKVGSPKVTGPFCGVPKCLFTGAPHLATSC